MRIFDEKKENDFFSISINEMSLNSSYVHGVKIYEDVTELVKKMNDGSTNLST